MLKQHRPVNILLAVRMRSYTNSKICVWRAFKLRGTLQMANGPFTKIKIKVIKLFHIAVSHISGYLQNHERFRIACLENHCSDSGYHEYC